PPREVPEDAAAQRGGQGGEAGDERRLLRRRAPLRRARAAALDADRRGGLMFVGSVAFVAAAVGARIITHAIRARVGPFRNLSVGGRHLHHMVFGIGGLLGTGYLWLLLVGTDQSPRGESRATAAAFGAASALTLDEFAL